MSNTMGLRVIDFTRQMRDLDADVPVKAFRTEHAASHSHKTDDEVYVEMAQWTIENPPQSARRPHAVGRSLGRCSSPRHLQAIACHVAGGLHSERWCMMAS